MRITYTIIAYSSFRFLIKRISTPIRSACRNIYQYNQNGKPMSQGVDEKATSRWLIINKTTIKKTIP
jgi:hypothetical protein